MTSTLLNLRSILRSGKIVGTIHRNSLVALNYQLYVSYKKDMESSLNLKQWTLLAHLSGFVGFIFPLGNILGPLIIWLLKKEQSQLLEEHAREALNFQISIAIYALVASILFVVIIGMVLLPVIIIIQIILMIKAALAADKNEFYRYPFTIRFIKHP